MALIPILIYALIGLIAGFFGGLLGIGGGLVTVPGLTWAFNLLNIQSDYSMRIAIGTSLAAMVFTAGISTYSHFKRKGILWKQFISLAPGILVGAIAAAFLASYLPNHLTKRFFGIFETGFGVYYLFFHRLKSESAPMNSPPRLVMIMIGIGIGALSTFLGIGGGIVTVPILSSFGTPMKNAIATSAATGFLIALVGAISFLLLGLHLDTIPGAVGYLYIPAFITIGIAALIIVPIGAKLTYKFRSTTLKHTFGIFLILTGVSMLVR